MNTRRSSRLAGPLLVMGLALAPPAGAQEEAPTEAEGSKLGHLFVNIESWVAQPTGLEYVPATQLDLDSTIGLSRTLDIEPSTDDALRYQVEWEMPSDTGRLRVTLYKHEDQSPLEMLSPTNFVFGEVLTHPVLAGVNNDGLADGFSSLGATRLRDLRIDFSRPAFSSPRISVDWFIGWRRVEHSRNLAAEYYALVPGFPPLLDPAGDCNPVPACEVDPIPDTANVGSSYDGRGATAGVELEFPMWRNQVVVEGDLSVSVMRGDTTSSYTAQNSFYLLGGDTLLGPPYDEFDDLIDVPGSDPPIQVPVIDSITQETFPIALESDQSATSEVYDAALGLRWRTPLKRLEVFAGMRQTHYEGVGTDVRPKSSTFTFTETGAIVLNLVDIEEVDRSVTYEGFYGGVRVRLY